MANVDNIRTLYRRLSHVCMRCAQRPTGRMEPGLCDDCSRFDTRKKGQPV